MNLKIDVYKKNENGDFTVTFDNIEIGYASDGWAEEGNRYLLHFDLKIFDYSSVYTLEDFFNQNVGAISLPIDTNRFKNLTWVESQFSSVWMTNQTECEISLKPNFLKWNKSIDLSLFINRLGEKLSNKKILIADNLDLFEEGLILISNVDIKEKLNNEYDRLLEIIDETVESILLGYEIEKNSEYVISNFSFPPEIRSACEQYLLYFSKFLEDLGIEVVSKLDSQYENTLFMVSPKNSDEALSNIRDLLNLYLTFPESNIIENTSITSFDISTQQLMANIFHLKSQLLLANSIIQAKDATIEALNLVNYQHKISINLQSNQNEEKTLGGLITLDQFEAKGIKINIAEIFRRLKKQLKK